MILSLGALAGACGSGDSGPAAATHAPPPPAAPTGPAGPPPNGAGTSLPAGVTRAPDGTLAGGGDPPGPDGGPPPAPYTDFQINHVLMTGQSNSVSNNGTPVLTKEQPYGNLMFDTGVMPGRGCDASGCAAYDTPSGFRPLVEGDHFFSYPVETAGSSIANQISFLAQGRYADAIPGLPDHHDVLVSLHGRSGNTYWCLRKTGCGYKPGYNHPFQQGMQEVQSGIDLARAAGKSYVVRAVVAIHGESDHYSYTVGLQEFPNAGTDGTPGKIQTYADALVEWQGDYETSVRELTHQTQPIPMFISQLAGWNDAKYSKVAQYQLEAHARAPGKVVLIGPSYALELAQTDCRHFTSVGEQHLGEMFGKVYGKVVLEGKTWEPVRPRTVTRTGAEITVSFFVPEPPLVLDTELVAETKDMGFEYLDTAGAVRTISKVELTGPDTVKLTLAGDVGPGHLTYAQNQAALSCIGTPRGARGNLRDSDSTPSRLGMPLYNWSVHFDVEVP